MKNIDTKNKTIQSLDSNLESIVINQAKLTGQSLTYIIADDGGALYRVILTEYSDNTGRVEVTDPNGEKPAILFEAYKGGINEGRAKAIDLINRVSLRRVKNA